MRGSKIVAALTMCALLLAGCSTPQSPDEIQTQDDGEGPQQGQQGEKGEVEEKNPIHFEWYPPDEVTEFAFWVEVQVGESTECSFESVTQGDLYGTSSDLVSFGFSYDESIEEPGFYGSVHRGESSVHHGPVHSKDVTGAANEMLVSQVVGGTWESASSIFDFSNETRGLVQAALGFESQSDPSIVVECEDDDALISFYVADEFHAVSSSQAEGGTGFHISGAASSVTGQHTWNQADIYSLESESDFVLLDLIQWPRASSATSEGEIVLRAPSGEEQQEWDLENELWHLHRLWQEPGSYEFEFSQMSTDYAPLMGIFAAFSLVEQVGSLKPNEAA